MIRSQDLDWLAAEGAFGFWSVHINVLFLLNRVLAGLLTLVRRISCRGLSVKEGICLSGRPTFALLLSRLLRRSILFFVASAPQFIARLLCHRIQAFLMRLVRA